MRSTTRSVPSFVLGFAAICLLPLAGCDGDDVAMDPVSDAGPPDAAASPAREFAVLVRGTLFTPDMTMAQTRHDEIAGGGRDAALAAGDFGHDVLLGTSILGTTENQFLAIDRWRDVSALRAFYSDPMIAGAFATLFAGPPSIETFERQGDWTSWSDLDAIDQTSPHFFVVARGHLAATTTAESRDAHNALVSGTADMARAAGDVGHIVYLGVEDPREFLAVDVWPTSDAIGAFYSNPDFARAIGSLYDAPPVIGVYRGTSWAQW